MSVAFRIGAATDVGQIRQVNQDSYVGHSRLAVVADGMGGHRGGEIASKIAVDTMLDQVPSNTMTTTDLLVQTVRTANHKIRAASEHDPALTGMGTTLCAAAVVGEGDAEQIAIVNVGDSRAYRLGEAGLEQLTEDHSLVAMLVKEGRITAIEAETHPQRNIVTRALGVSADVDVDWFAASAAAGQRFVLCSDGLFNEVADADIANVLQTVEDPADAAAMLVNAANEHGGRDNITVLVVDVLVDQGDEETEQASEAATASHRFDASEETQEIEAVHQQVVVRPRQTNDPEPERRSFFSRLFGS